MVIVHDVVPSVTVRVWNDRCGSRLTAVERVLETWGGNALMRRRDMSQHISVAEALASILSASSTYFEATKWCSRWGESACAHPAAIFVAWKNPAGIARASSHSICIGRDPRWPM